MVRHRRLLIVLSVIVLVLSLLAGLAAASTRFFGLADPDRVETGTELDDGAELRPAPVEEPKPGEEQSFPGASRALVAVSEESVGRRPWRRRASPSWQRAGAPTAPPGSGSRGGRSG
jgi:hypothetical protein